MPKNSKNNKARTNSADKVVHLTQRTKPARRYDSISDSKATKPEEDKIALLNTE